MEYRVVCGLSNNINGAISGLVNEVQKLIEEGYKPQGGIAISEDEAGGVKVCQAMIKLPSYGIKK